MTTETLAGPLSPDQEREVERLVDGGYATWADAEASVLGYATDGRTGGIKDTLPLDSGDVPAAWDYEGGNRTDVPNEDHPRGNGQPAKADTKKTISADDPEFVPRLERLTTIWAERGFMPTSLRELSEAYALVGFLKEKGSSAKHVAEIARHQERHDYEGLRAQMSVLREYHRYAARARYDRTCLITLREEIESTESLQNFSNPSAAMNTGRGALVRFMDLTELRTKREDADLPFYPLKDYTETPLPDDYTVADPRPEVAAHIDEVLNGLRTWDAKRWIDMAEADKEMQTKFWAERLKEQQKHMTGPVRMLAGKLLQQLGVNPTTTV